MIEPGAIDATTVRSDPDDEATRPISTQKYHLESCTGIFGVGDCGRE
jgi:hypothetical protein